MATTERVTVTLPLDLVRDIDRVEANRSKFVAEAVRHELARRRREGLRRSLAAPHSETADFADEGMTEWAKSLPAEDAEGLVDVSKGKPVRWTPGEGWIEVVE